MKTKIFAILVLLSLVGVATANGATYDNTVTLENKNPSTWQAIDDDFSATVDFKTSGPKFEWHAEGTTPLSKTMYVLIYYADKPKRFHYWGGDNPGALIAKITTDKDGNFDVYGSTELGMNLPTCPDWNMHPDPADEYCSEPDNYVHCCGAKLWMVPITDYDTEKRKVIKYNPTTYLFETDLIWYADTDEYQPQDLCEYIICKDKCFGYDLWSQKCVCEVCMKDTIIHVNCPECGYVEPDPCEGIVCDGTICIDGDVYNMICDGGECIPNNIIEECSGTICIEYDLYQRVCIDDACVDVLIEMNSPCCINEPQGPCEDVTCPDKCFGTARWSQKCVDGICVNDTLQNPNCTRCGYVPPEPCDDMNCDGVTCVGYDLYNMKCVGGVCVPDMMIQSYSNQCGAPYDPCGGKLCDGLCCVGVDLYSMCCVNGECVPFQWYEKNSTQCGYVPPEPEPEPEVDDDGCPVHIPGDVTGDGTVNIADAILLFNWVAYPDERGTTYILK